MVTNKQHHGDGKSHSHLLYIVSFTRN